MAILLQEDWTDVDQTLVANHTPGNGSSNPVAPSNFDNGSGTGVAPSSGVFPTRIQTNRASNAKTDGTGGRCVCGQTGFRDLITVRAVVRKANTFGLGGGAGFVFRCDDRRAMPEDNTIQADDGDFAACRFEWNGASIGQVRVDVFIDGNGQNVFVSNPFPFNENETQELGADIQGETAQVWRETTPGDPNTRIVVVQYDLRNGGAHKSLNDANHTAIGIDIPNRSIIDEIDTLIVEDFQGVFIPGPGATPGTGSFAAGCQPGTGSWAPK